MVELLFEKEANVIVYLIALLLHLATENGYGEIVEFFIEKGANEIVYMYHA